MRAHCARRRRRAVGVGGQIWRSLRGGGGQKREAVLLAAASAARQQGCRTVGSQSVNLTLNVNVSGGRTPGAKPDAALTPRTGRTVASTVTTPTTPWTGLTLTVARCLSASLLAPYHTVLSSKKVVNWTLETM